MPGTPANENVLVELPERKPHLGDAGRGRANTMRRFPSKVRRWRARPIQGRRRSVSSLPDPPRQPDRSCAASSAAAQPASLPADGRAPFQFVGRGEMGHALQIGKARRRSVFHKLWHERCVHGLTTAAAAAVSAGQAGSLRRVTRRPVLPPENAASAGRPPDKEGVIRRRGPTADGKVQMRPHEACDAPLPARATGSSAMGSRTLTTCATCPTQSRRRFRG